MIRSHADRLSLTLPAASRSRTRRKRWTPPPFWFWWFMAFAIFWATWSVLDFLGGNLILALSQTGGTCWYWCAAWRAKAHLPWPSYWWWLPITVPVIVLIWSPGS